MRRPAEVAPASARKTSVGRSRTPLRAELGAERLALPLAHPERAPFVKL